MRRLFVLAALLGLGAGSAPGSASAALSELRRGTANEPRTLDPHYVQGNAGAAIMYDLFESLMSLGPKGELVPGIAERWARSPDGLTYTFNLRAGLKWSDGRPLTSADVLNSWRRAVDPKLAARSARVLFPVKNAREILRGRLPVTALGAAAPDARTLVVTLSRPTPYFLELMVSFSAAPVPLHVIEKRGEAWTTPQYMVTNGAYTLAEFASNSYIRLRRNANYRDAANVKIEQVTYFPIEKPETALTRFRAGELEVAFGVPPNRLDFVRQNLARELRSSDVGGVYYLLLNNARPPLDDARIRRALSLAVDRRVITNGILRIGDRAAYSLVPPAMDGYAEVVPDWARQAMPARIAEARRLLQQAGYGPSKPLRLEYKTGGQENNRRIAVAVQAMWRPLGVQAEIRNVGASTIVTDAASGNFQVMRYQYYAPFEDPVAFLNLLETGATVNLSRFSDKRFDDSLLQADGIADPAARIQRLRSAEALAMQQFPVIPIYFNRRLYLVSQRVQGWYDNNRGENLSRHLGLMRDRSKD